MSTSLQSPPAPRTTVAAWRRWFPVLTLALAGVALAAIWTLPGGETARRSQSIGTYATVSSATLLLLVWLLLLAPFRVAVRLGILAGALALVGAFVGSLALGWLVLEFDGDMMPRLRWGRSLPELRGGNTAASVSGPNDWPEYRGPRRDGVVHGPPLSEDWSAAPPRQVWQGPEKGKRPHVGEGLSAFAVAGDIAVTLEQRGDNEAVVAYSVRTGEPVWVHFYPARFYDIQGGLGPRSTPTVADGEVYSLGATGKLVCLDARTGKEKWTRDVLENNANVKWGLSGSPLVLADVVVVNAGAQTAQAPGTLVAHDRKTGKRVWASGRAHAGYSSPMRATLAGTPQVVLFDGDGISGYDPAQQGKQLWRYPWTTLDNIQVAQPVVVGEDRLFVSSGYGVGCALLQVKKGPGGWTAGPLWRNIKMRCAFSSPVLHEGHLYGLDEGVLVCLDVEKGKPQWRGERYGHGQLLLTNGRLLILAESGELALVEATPKHYRELTRFQALEGRTWNLPALAGGFAFVRNHLEMACYDLKAGGH
jgi:outer membrane protein assembly factor BamB